MRVVVACLAIMLVGCGTDDNVRIVRGINGVNGIDGVDGVDGVNGKDGQNGQDGVNGISGNNGRDGVDGVAGVDGSNGTNGVDGKDGIAGKDGLDGVNGRNAFVEIIDPCGDAPNIIDEVLLRMPDGKILASFSENVEGRNTRFSLIPDGTFMTTDGSGCVFTVREGEVL
jgi:hypothetical protein